jgi:hypothetical protein
MFYMGITQSYHMGKKGQGAKATPFSPLNWMQNENGLF